MGYRNFGDGDDNFTAYKEWDFSNPPEIRLVWKSWEIYGNGGHDTLTGGEKDDTIEGGAGNDSIFGRGGFDTLRGGSGDDYLDGGTGGDDMYGGLNNDRYIVDHILDEVVEYYNQGIDTVRSNLDSYTLTANVENLDLTGNAYHGRGNGLANQITGMRGDNLLEGLDGDDTLSGDDGDDTLKGGLGNDYLEGGLGADTMRGGDDDDEYVVESAGDVVIEEFNEGTDTVYASTPGYTLGDNLENLVLEGGATFGEGNELDNVITANSNAPSSNTLQGNDGADILYGSDLSDYLDGGNDGDVDNIYGGDSSDVFYIKESIDQVIEYANEGLHDRVEAHVSYQLTDYVEELELAGSAYTGEGNSLDNYISGTNSDNRLLGHDGNDELLGRGGFDTLLGGIGNDILQGASTSQVGEYDALFGEADADTFVLGTRLTGVEYLGLGNARIMDFDRSEGDKIQVRGNISDYRVESNPWNNDAKIYYQDDVIGHVENTADVSLEADFIFSFMGSDQQETLIGSNTSETLIGSSKRDTLDGQAGDDTLLGNGDRDTLIGGLGNDTLDGGADIDTARYTSSTSGITLNLRDGTASDGFGGTDTLISIEQVVGSDFKDVMFGSDADDILFGGDSKDQLYGRDGNDELYGEDGNDILRGEAGADRMVGGDGDDIAYVDHIGDEVFEEADEGIDRVRTSLNNYVLPDHVERLELLSGADTGYGNSLNNGLFGQDNTDAAEVLFGGAGDDDIYGYSGDDTLHGEADSDRLFGGFGNDTLSGGLGTDTLYGVDVNAANPGAGEIDMLTGNAEQDTFALGYSNNDQVFYADGGDSDYALITDFSRDVLTGGDDDTESPDVIQIKGTFEDYELRLGTGTGPFGTNDTGIYFTQNGANDLIAVVENITDLNSGDFTELGWA